MKKWSFLVAALLMASATVTTTSCIDNDEPEGITVLRGAKAELLKAKAALELAKAETEKQQANYVAALASVEQARALTQQAIAKQEEAKAKQEEAKIAAEQAKSDKEKAEAMEALALAEQAVAQAKLDMETAKAQFELDMLTLEEQIAAQQASLENTMAEIEAAKAILTAEQAKQLGELQAAIYGPKGTWEVLKDAKNEVLKAEKALIAGGHSQEDKVEELEDAVVEKTADLVALNAALEVLQDLAANTEITEWELQLDSLKAYVGQGSKQGLAAEAIAQLELQKLEIELSDAYKAKQKEDNEARMAYVAAQQEYNYLANGTKNDCFAEDETHEGEVTATFGTYQDGTHPTTVDREAKKYAFDGANIAIGNNKAFTKIGDALKAYDAANGTSYASTLKNDWAGKHLQVDGIPEWAGVVYTEISNPFKNFVSWSDDGNHAIAKTVAVWEEVLKTVKVTEEEIADDACIADYEKKVHDADSLHQVAVAKWKAAHETYANQKVAKSVDTKTIKDAIALYNANIEALEAAVKDYNTAFDAAKTALYNKNLEGKKIVEAESEIDAVLGTIGSVGTRRTLAQLDALVASSSLSAADQTQMKKDIRTAINDKWKTKTAAFIEAAEIASVPSVVEVEGEDSVKEAYKKIHTADNKGILDKITATDGGYDSSKKVYTGSYATIAKAVEDFITAAGKNSEKQTDKAVDASTTAKQQGYTGVAPATAKKYILENTLSDASTKDAPNYAEITASDWVVYKAELNNADEYEYQGHLQLLRTKVSDDAIKAMTAVELDQLQAAKNWVNYSNEAFGTSVPGTITVDTEGKVNEETNARHTELKKDMINDGKDENGKEVTGGTIAALINAENKLAAHKDYAVAQEEIDKVKTAIADAKKAMIAQVQGYKDAVDAAEKAIEPAKKEHQAKHQAAKALTAEVDQQIQNIKDTKDELGLIKTKLEAIIKAYYSNTEFAYVEYDPATGLLTEKVKTVKDFATTADKCFTDWVTNEINGYIQREGKIAKAEEALEKAQKAYDRFVELNKTGNSAPAAEYMEMLEADLENAKAELEVAQKLYDFSLEQLNAYVAALSK